MYKKGISLISLMVVIIVLGILAVVAIPNIKDIADDTRLSATLENKTNVQKAVDRYLLEKQEFPVETPRDLKIGEPQQVKWELLSPDYLREKPADLDKIYYWVDYNGSVFASDIDAPQNIVINTVLGTTTITWDEVDGAKSYEVGYIDSSLAHQIQTRSLKGLNASTSGYKVLGIVNSGDALSFDTTEDLTGKTVVLISVSENFKSVPVKVGYTGSELDRGAIIEEDNSMSLASLNRNNVSNAGGGLYVTDDEWIYYSSLNDGNKLYKKRLDGSDKTLLSSHSVGSLSIDDEWIYFRNNSFGGRLYKIKKDGSLMNLLYSGNSQNIIVDNEWIYFINVSSDSNLYRIKTDGTNVSSLIFYKVSSFALSDDSIFFNDRGASSPYKAYKSNKDGNDIEEIFSRQISSLVISGEWVYFINEDGNRNIYKIKTDGTNLTQVNNEISSFLIVLDDEVFYRNVTDEGKLYKISVNGENRTPLTNYSLIGLQYANGYIYYRNSEDSYSMYKMKPDGSEIEKAN